MQHHDTVVIGAGVAGASVAWHLGGALVLEQGAEVAREATSQNAGMVRRLSEDPIERALAFRSWDFFEQEDWGASTRTGAVLALAHDPWHLHDAVAVLRLRGARVERGSDLEVLQGARLAEVWSLDMGEDSVSGTPLIEDGSLILGTMQGRVLVLDPESGDEKKTLQLDQVIEHGPFKLGSHLVVVSIDGSLYRIESSLGEGS